MTEVPLQRHRKAYSLGVAFPPVRGRNRVRDDGTQIPRLGVLAHRPIATANAQPNSDPRAGLHRPHPRPRLAHANRSQTRGILNDAVTRELMKVSGVGRL